MTEVVLKTGAIRRAKLQSNRRHQQTNTQIFTCQVSFVLPNQQCQGTERKLHRVSSVLIHKRGQRH